MIQAISTIRTKFQSLYRDEEGAIAFEYVLVIAGVSVAVIATMAFAMPVFTQAILDGTCGALNSLSWVTVTCP